MNARTAVILWICAFVLFPTMAPAQESMDSALLDRLNKHYGSIDTFVADYVQESKTQALGGPQPITMKEINRGVIYFRKPGLFLVDQKEPRSETVIANAEYTWWVIPEENKVYRYPPQSRSGVIKALSGLLSGREKLEDFFRLSLVETDDSELVIGMSPLEPAEDFQRLDATLDKRSLKLLAMRVIYPLGQEVLFEFNSVQEDTALPKDFFEYSPPADARVIINE